MVYILISVRLLSGRKTNHTDRTHFLLWDFDAEQSRKTVECHRIPNANTLKQQTLALHAIIITGRASF